MGADSNQPLLSIEGLSKRFGENIVLDGAKLNVPRGSLVTVLGRSGATMDL